MVVLSGGRTLSLRSACRRSNSRWWLVSRPVQRHFPHLGPPSFCRQTLSCYHGDVGLSPLQEQLIAF